MRREGKYYSSAAVGFAAKTVAVLSLLFIFGLHAEALDVRPTPGQIPSRQIMALLNRSAAGVLSRSRDDALVQPAVTALQCLAALGLMRAGMKPARVAVRQTVDRLVKRAVRGPDGGIKGWSLLTKHRSNCAGPGTMDTFSDGTCNSAETTYAFQTGLAVTCLARAGVALNEGRYKTAAAAALGSWASLVDHPAGCPRCVEFHYSDNPNDLGRHVRNTNALMGMGAIWTHRATGDARARTLAEGVAAAETREVRNSNSGYLGIDDPAFAANPVKESVHIDNHVPYVAKGVFDVAFVLGDTALTAISRKIMESWLTCAGQRCSELACKRWAARFDTCRETQIAAPCFFSRDTEFGRLCSIALSRLAVLDDYQTWAVTDGLLSVRAQN